MRGKVDERDRQYHIEYDGKGFKRDISMLIPVKQIQTIDVNRHDPTAETPLQVKPALFKSRVILREEELILCKTNKGDKAWSLAEVHKIYPDEIEVIYYTTPRKQLDEYETATHE